MKHKISLLWVNVKVKEVIDTVLDLWQTEWTYLILVIQNLQIQCFLQSLMMVTHQLKCGAYLKQANEKNDHYSEVSQSRSNICIYQLHEY